MGHAVNRGRNVFSTYRADHVSGNPVSGHAWWNEFFDDAYADISLVPRTAEAERAQEAAASFLKSKLRLDAGATVFDQCCGIGRLSLPLAARGVRVVGVDL